MCYLQIRFVSQRCNLRMAEHTRAIPYLWLLLRWKPPFQSTRCFCFSENLFGGLGLEKPNTMDGGDTAFFEESETVVHTQCEIAVSAARKGNVAEAELALKSARAALRECQVEARGQPGNDALKARTALLSEKVPAIATQVRNVIAGSDRTSLLDGAGSARAGTSAESRSRMETSTSKLKEGTTVLTASMRTVAETTLIAESILGDLDEHRGKLKAIHAKVGEVDAAATEGNAIAKRMGNFFNGWFG